MCGKEQDKKGGIEGMKNIINFFTSTFLTTIVYYLGGLDTALKTLLILIILDYVTGLCKAIITKKINSLIGLKGIVKKVINNPSFRKMKEFDHHRFTSCYEHSVNHSSRSSFIR